ncbi:uncharacterized protein LOC144500925 [Mustelus asterias]
MELIFMGKGLGEEKSLGVRGRVALVPRAILPRDCGLNRCNPLYLTVKQTEWMANGGRHMCLDNEVLGVRVREERLCCVRIMVQKATAGNSPVLRTATPALGSSEGIRVIQVKDLRKTIEIETGFGETNAWMEWVKYTVQSLEKGNCYACTGSRPTPQVVPFPVGWDKEPKQMECLVKLYQHRAAWDDPTCQSLGLTFPPVRSNRESQPPVFSGVLGTHHTCVSRTGEKLDRQVGTFDRCGTIKEVNDATEEGNYSQIQVPRADLWWYCGGGILRPTLPRRWKGTCAIVQLVVSFTLAFEHPEPRGDRRAERSLSTSFDDQVYLDNIGVPRGVPDEYKARNQIMAGFESLFWWVTINKNVDWINYIYYNQQRFINYTRDAVKGIAEQLDATSRMAWENRLALDMILAEKGGVCVMIGTQCCTFIPNNIAPDGSITRALEGLTTLADELAENSGVDTDLTGWLERWFGKWKGVVVSALISFIVVAGVLVALGCCVIPCIRGLTQRLIETALTKRDTLDGRVVGLHLTSEEGQGLLDAKAGNGTWDEQAGIMREGLENTLGIKNYSA